MKKVLLILSVMFLAIFAVLFSGANSTNANGQETCPEGDGWVKVNSDDLSLYPVEGATEYCFKAGSDNSQGCDGGLFSSWPQSEGTCGLRHWSYFVPEEEPTPTPADDATTVPLSEEGQEIVDVFFGDEDEVDSSILNEAVEEALALSEDSLALIGSQELKLKSLGLSKYYVRLKGILDAKNYDGLVCTVRTSTYEGKETIKENFLVDPEYFKLSKNEFNLRLPSKSAKYRFDRRIKIPLLPIGTGLNLLKKRIGSIDMRIKIFCVSYKSNDPELLQYLEDEELSLKDLSIVDVLTYPRDARNIRTYVDLVDLDIFAPESVKVHK